jgi:tetratricopeptide (TPR) repeat protein
VDGMITLDELTSKGDALKRAGDLEGAKDCYMQALDIDPFNRMTYIHLGKIAHLLKAQDLAVRCYLASLHLELAQIEKDIHDHSLPIHLQVQYDTIPEDILDQLPQKSAFIIFADSDVPRLIAHSIIDLSPKALNVNPQLKAYSDIYNAELLEDGAHDETLGKWGLTSSDETNTDEEVYIPFGQNFLLDALQWDQLSRNDVLNIYS